MQSLDAAFCSSWSRDFCLICDKAISSTRISSFSENPDILGCGLHKKDFRNPHHAQVAEADAKTILTTLNLC